MQDYDPFAGNRAARIAEREDEYRARRRMMIISPARHDPFADGKIVWTLFLNKFQYLFFTLLILKNVVLCVIYFGGPIQIPRSAPSFEHIVIIFSIKPVFIWQIEKRGLKLC